MINIPNNAKKVHEGILFDVYQWDQEMFDGTTEIFERLTRKASVEVIAEVDGKILTIMQEQPARKGPYPSFPGGRIDEGETAIEAAHRELREETGYTAESMELWKTYHGTSKITFDEYIFIAKGLKKTDEIQEDAGEKIKLQSFSFDETLSFCRNPQFTAAMFLKFDMYEMLLDEEKKQAFYHAIFS
ncbi:NUDIX domain-containing protein [Patescibacteria group bacterium]|nr:NUDIX domain-containing protein [Patescibacteria group bacterium]MBU1721189.1 NUDIX domain-containing protein [Patescibacteria group bacterium]MBU1901103.1 NUDIX domain-containing protein [Patescibacteria group bacterium]